jgi:outer membrane protein OmpA-like peptidoglycan-associated protein
VLLGWLAWPSPRPTAVAATRPSSPPPPPPSPAVSRVLDAPAVEAEPPPADGTSAALLAPLRYRVAGAMPEDVDAAALRAFAEDLERRCRGRRIVLTGHTCNIGAPKQNLALGRERARYARQLLVAAGVDEAIEVRSAGSRAPIVSNRNEAGRQQNRRVTASCAETPEGKR